MYSSFKPIMDHFMTIGVPGFDAIILKDGECVFRYRGGYSDAENQIPMQGNERYNLYSCTKMVTCTAALQLWEKGLLDLDAPLYTYLPEYRNVTVRQGDQIVPAKNAITIRHLLTMTGGFSYDVRTPGLQKLMIDTNGDPSTRQVAKALAEEPLLFEPGTQWNYSLGHDVLGAVIEVIAGIPFSQYVRENIFKPLGMHNTSIGATDEELQSIAPIYYYDRATGVRTCLGKTDYARRAFGPSFESGGAGCISTVEDFVKFLEALRIGDIILKKETIDMMASDQLTDQQRETYWWKHRCSYGFGVHCAKAGTDSHFFSWGGAAGAEPLIHREKGITFFYARHILEMNNDAINDQLREHLRSLL